MWSFNHYSNAVTITPTCRTSLVMKYHKMTLLTLCTDSFQVLACIPVRYVLYGIRCPSTYSQWFVYISAGIEPLIKHQTRRKTYTSFNVKWLIVDRTQNITTNNTAEFLLIEKSKKISCNDNYGSRKWQHQLLYSLNAFLQLIGIWKTQTIKKFNRHSQCAAFLFVTKWHKHT